MEHPSQAWLDKFNDTLVPEEFVEISYNSTEPGVQEDATASATAQVPFGNIENTTKELDRVLTKYATGETNLHVLDGSFRLLPDSVPYADAGFISQTLVSDSSHPRIILSFGSVHTRAVPGLTVVWSSMMNEWAAKFKLTAYKGTAVVSTITVSNNRSVYSKTEWEIYGYDSIAIDILEWSIPNRRARIEWIMVGLHKVYSKKDIVSYTHTSSRDPISAQLPKDSIEFSLDNSQKTWDAINPRGMFRYLYERQEVDVRYGMDVDGETQWINGGKFYLSEWSVPSNGLEASFTARDALEFMMTSNYTGRKTGTLYQMCYDALETLPSNVPSFYISEELKEYSTDISSEKTSYKNSDILQLAANAAGMALYQTRDGHIRIERVNLTAEEGTEVYEIPVINNFQWPEISFASRVKNVSCNVNGKEHLYPEGSNAEGVTQTVSNELLTEAMLVKSKNSITEAYAMLANRKKVELEYRASPHIDAFDHVKFNHNFGYASSVFVTESKYQYTGCFKGTISGYVLADVSSVSLSSSSLSLIYNEPKVLTAELLPYDPDLPTVSWRASPEGIVTLRVLTNESGKSTCEVKYNRKGNATVSAYVGSVSSSIPVVNNSPSLYLSTRALGVRWGAPQDITATFVPNNYGAPEINWSASPSDVVRLDIVAKSNGSSTCRVTWLKKGSATITVTAAEEKSTCSVVASPATIGSLPIGTTLYIKENNQRTAFVLAKHDYEEASSKPGLITIFPGNGKGLSLLARSSKTVLSHVWNTESGPYPPYTYLTNIYSGSTIDKWLNGEYFRTLDSNISSKIKNTNIRVSPGPQTYKDDDDNSHTTDGSEVTWISRKVFLLSATELGMSSSISGITKEGTVFPNGSEMLYNIIGSSNYTWTRSRCFDATPFAYPESFKYNSSAVVSPGKYKDGYYTYTAIGDVSKKYPVIPAFTLPATLEVDVNGNVLV
jgi:hypothetical protein|nr:MAG TPA: hypothetical protein [Caudoviricetes sp.]